ncbi:MAG: prepilin-type N-terminal cleavage/methylation domain-containing protein [Verrucomicrobiota bacterium]|nr:prepilin-type N-terminal cleavage/methylation domain-containing protein [Verrucomicrobiota bacterium]
MALNPIKTRRLKGRNTRGFTLIELLLALGIATAVLVAAIAYTFSISNIWVNRSQNDFFRQHVDGVTLFLTNCFARAEEVPLGAGVEGNDEQPAQTEPADNGTPREQDPKAAAAKPKLKDPVVWERPPKYGDFEEPLITFHLNEPPAILSDLGIPLPALTCHLFYKKREGLSLLWYSQLQKVEDMNDVRSTPLSTYLTNLEYAYYNSEDNKWDIVDKPKQNDNSQFILPDALQLTFTYQEEVITTAVYLPLRDQNVPLY